MERRSAELQAAIEEKEKQRAKEESRLQELDKDIKEWSQSTGDLTDRKYRIEVQCSRYEVELENFQNNIWEEYEITYNNAVPFKDDTLTPGAVNQQIQTLKKEISALGEVNVNAIEEFKRVGERYNFLNEQRTDLLTAKENLKEIIRDITVTMKKRFQEEFVIINQYFGVTFNKLFGGGHARLILEDPEDVLNCGIDIIAQPPGKKLQSLSLLSGGERALTAIAILFAILKHKPTPFCVLDEIDAALDDSNVFQFGNYVKEFSKDTQFAIITHRKGTMEVSDVLYGIAMEEKGVSKLISVKFDEMVS
jgi:chromosome segregation protein